MLRNTDKSMIPVFDAKILNLLIYEPCELLIAMYKFTAPLGRGYLLEYKNFFVH